MTFYENLGLSERSDIQRSLNKIADDLTRPRRSVGFLFGSGMSIDAGLPSGLDLSKRLLKSIYPHFHDAKCELIAKEQPLEAIASVTELVSPGAKRETLKTILQKLCLDTPTRAEGLKAHERFAELVGLDYVRHIFTTNFDRLLETAIGSRAKAVTQEDAHTLQELGQVPVYHLHGMIEDDSYVITEEDIYAQKHRHAQFAFRTALYQCDSFVFVGYSMNDPDLRQVFVENQNEVRHRSQNPHKTSYVVIPFNDEERFLVSKQVWQTRNAVLLPFTAEEFFVRVHESIESNAIAELSEEIKMRRGCDDAFLETLIADAKELTSSTSTKDALVMILRGGQN